MAFKYASDKDRIPFYKSGSVDKKPPFRATGKGLAVDHRFRATEFTANASLTAGIRAADGSSHLGKFFLFVTRVSTGWQLSGQTAQTAQSRSFYPRNMIQGDLLIEGVCTSQAEYDRLVEFVQAHHLSITSVGDNPVLNDSSVQTQPVRFAMGQDRNSLRPRTYKHAPKMLLDVAITSIVAGHERFKFQPTFSLVCKVLNDHLQDKDDVEFDIMKMLDRETMVRDVVPTGGGPAVTTSIFGSLGNPLPAGTVDVNTLGTIPASTQQKMVFTGGSGGSGGGDFAPGDPSWPVASNAQYIGRANAAAPGLSNPEAGNPIKVKFGLPADGKQYFAQWADLRSDGTVDPNNIKAKFRDPPGAGNTISIP